MRWKMLAFALSALIAGGAAAERRGQEKAGEREGEGPHGKQARFREFLEKVSDYDKLRASLRNGIPEVGKKATAEEIDKHKTALVEKIQEARKDAKPGDMFTPDSQKAFRRAIDRAH